MSPRDPFRRTWLRYMPVMPASASPHITSFRVLRMTTSVVAMEVVSMSGWPICTPMKIAPATTAQMPAAPLRRVVVMVMRPPPPSVLDLMALGKQTWAIAHPFKLGSSFAAVPAARCLSRTPRIASIHDVLREHVPPGDNRQNDHDPQGGTSYLGSGRVHVVRDP